MRVEPPGTMLLVYHHFSATWVILLSPVSGHQKRHGACGEVAVTESE